jgi:hypothetical protein
MPDNQDGDIIMTEKSAGKLRFGAVILIVGFLSPLLIPLVVASNWSATAITVVSGLLAFGIPELFMLLAIAVMGKPGYEYIKAKVLIYLKRLAPPDKVSLVRFRIGMVMFSLPIMIGILKPYLAYFVPLLQEDPLWIHIGLDVIFIIGLFVLGGDFWDRLSGLFKFKSK